MYIPNEPKDASRTQWKEKLALHIIIEQNCWKHCEIKLKLTWNIKIRDSETMCVKLRICDTNSSLLTVLIKAWNRLTMHCTKNEVFHQEFLQWMWPNLQETADLVTFTEEILNGKLRFFCSDTSSFQIFSFIFIILGTIIFATTGGWFNLQQLNQLKQIKPIFSSRHRFFLILTL